MKPDDHITDEIVPQGIAEKVLERVHQVQEAQFVAILDEHLPHWRTQPWTHASVEERKFPPLYERTAVYYRSEISIAGHLVGEVCYCVSVRDDVVEVSQPHKKAPSSGA